MSPKETSVYLRGLAEKYKGKFIPMFSVYVTIRVADTIDRLDKMVTGMSELPNCNTCSNLSCGVKPEGGAPLRFNCHLYL